MTGWRRPELTNAVLDALAQCCGSERYEVLLHLEPGHEAELLRVVSKVRPFVVHTSVNKTVLGISANTLSALEHGFSKAEFVIHLEDDSLPLPNALRFFEWFDERRTLRDLHRLATLSAYSTHQGLNHDAATPDEVFVQRWFSCSAWATWRDTWQSMKRSWGGDARGFARHVCGYQLLHDLRQAYPGQSLCQNIGFGAAGSVNAAGHTTPGQVCHHGADPRNYWISRSPGISRPCFMDADVTPSEVAVAMHWIASSLEQGCWRYPGSVRNRPWTALDILPSDAGPVLLDDSLACSVDAGNALLDTDPMVVVTCGNGWPNVLVERGYRLEYEHLDEGAGVRKFVRQ